jgi:hypothetical protein
MVGAGAIYYCGGLKLIPGIINKISRARRRRVSRNEAGLVC